MNLNQITIPARDIDSSVNFYLTLGFELIVRTNNYARFFCSEGGSSFSVHLTQTVGNNDTVVYFECQQLDAQVELLRAKGISFSQMPQDEPWLWREARLLDPGGNTLCLYYAGENRLYPPWRISTEEKIKP